MVKPSLSFGGGGNNTNETAAGNMTNSTSGNQTLQGPQGNALDSSGRVLAAPRDLLGVASLTCALIDSPNRALSVLQCQHNYYFLTDSVKV